MGYIALITLDLPGATDEQRSLFYETLRNEKWQKIKSLTTAWKALFNDSVTRDEAIDGAKKAQTPQSYFTVERIKNSTKDESILKESSSLIQKYKSEYAYLFSIIYKFYKTPSDTNETIYYLPNILRKFVETYLNFKFLSFINIEESIGRLIPNSIDCERARKFMHYYSHSLTTDSFMRFPDLAECSDTVRIVLEAIEKDDPTHYKSLVERAVI